MNHSETIKSAASDSAISTRRLYEPPIKAPHPDYLTPGKASNCPAKLVIRGRTHFCTRDRGHDGDHAAHGDNDRQHARWNDGVTDAVGPQRTASNEPAISTQSQCAHDETTPAAASSPSISRSAPSFVVKEYTVKVLGQLPEPLSDAVIDAFMMIADIEDGPRHAGTILAHRFVSAGARIAIFGACASGNEPMKEWWLEFCSERFDAALKAYRDDLCDGARETDAEVQHDQRSHEPSLAKAGA